MNKYTVEIRPLRDDEDHLKAKPHHSWLMEAIWYDENNKPAEPILTSVCCGRHARKLADQLHEKLKSKQETRH